MQLAPDTLDTHQHGQQYHDAPNGDFGERARDRGGGPCWAPRFTVLWQWQTMGDGPALNVPPVAPVFPRSPSHVPCVPSSARCYARCYSYPPLHPLVHQQPAAATSTQLPTLGPKTTGRWHEYWVSSGPGSLPRTPNHRRPIKALYLASVTCIPSRSLGAICRTSQSSDHELCQYGRATTQDVEKLLGRRGSRGQTILSCFVCNVVIITPS
jgi:hypothetical protein